ncbi:MAG TPA: DMT family transporter [Fodinibius sp.]|nr:DMT family transporter [Fodinibius sp.]
MVANENSKIRVVAALVAGLTAFGFAPILVRLAPDTSPFVLVVYRTVFAVLILLPVWLAMGNRKGLWLANGETPWIMLSGVCLGLHFTCWLASLYYTSVASASVLVTIHPIIMILVERLWFKKSFVRTTWIGVLMAFGGSLLLGFSDSQIDQAYADPLFGNMLAVIAALIFVIYLLIGQQLRKRRSWIDYVFPVYLYAAAATVVVAFIFGENLLDISVAGLWVGAGLAFGPQVMGHGSMNYAIKYISPTLLSTLILAEPLLASVMAYFFFAEQPPVGSIVGMVFILVGISLTWRRSSRSVG